MSMVRCQNGHFYNDQQHTTCPHPPCGPDLSSAVDSTRPLTGPTSADEGRTVPLRPATPAPVAAADAGQTVRSPGTPAPGPDAAPVSAGADDGVTVGFPGLRSGGSEADVATGFEPVAGWLVCIEGPDRGRDYRLKIEGNFIGRNPENDVVIGGDNEISRTKHAAIFYDPDEQTFVLMKGEMTRKSVHLNDKAIYTPVGLTARDVIRLGATKLMFVPFSGEYHDWMSGNEAQNDG